MSKAELSKKVMRSLAISPEPPHIFRDRSGNAPMVISLPNERVGDVFERARAVISDGGVNVVIAFAKQYSVMAFDSALHADAQVEVSPETSMGMLSLRSEQNPGKVIRVRMNDGGPLDVEFSQSLAYA